MHMTSPPRPLRNAPKQPASAGYPATPKDRTDIDLERLVYDPAYRKLVRDQLNRAARIKSAGPGRG